jgi:hypothetical protein
MQKLLTKSLSSRLVKGDLGKYYLLHFAITEKTLLNWRRANDRGDQSNLTIPASIDFFRKLGFTNAEILQSNGSK